MSQNPVKQHTVPCSYLQGFTHDPSKEREALIAVYDVPRDLILPRQKVNQVSIIKDFYTVEDDDGNKVYEVEEFLWQEVEWITHIVKQIEEKKQLSEKDASDLAHFIWFQEFRTKYRFERHNEFCTRMSQKIVSMSFANEEIAISSLRSTWKKLECSAKEIVEFVSKHAKDMQVKDQVWWIQNMFNLSKMVWQRLFYSKRQILYSSEWNFITSDHPMYLLESKWEPSHFGPWLYTASIWFPISKHCYLIADRKSINSYDPEDVVENRINYIETDNDTVKLCNYSSCRSISERIFGKDQDSLQDIIDIIKGEDKNEEIKQWIGRLHWNS